MNTVTLVVFAAVVLYLGYRIYGTYLEKLMDVDPAAKTPAHTKNDGVDYVPAKAPVLLGHHFASIAGAGPINGPIAASIFGWLPVAIWILIGSIFMGGVHDYTSLIASARHGGASVGEVIKKNVGKRGQFFFLLFSWSALVLVIAVFAILVKNIFVSTPAAATASVLFIVLAIAFGWAVNRMNVPLTTATVVGVILLFSSIAIGMRYPLVLDGNTWLYILFAYCFIASVAPVWILLQPRDYLNSYLLYTALAGALIGIIVGRPAIVYPAFVGFSAGGQYLFPMLFVTVACGAISGFHSLVSSGTTAKQLDNERDGKLIGYGGMLIEGLLAIIAVCTVGILGKDAFAQVMANPPAVFASGVGQFMGYIGIPQVVGTTFAALALSAFMMTSLDTGARLARYSFQEFFVDRAPVLSGSVVATAVSIGAAMALAFSGNWAAIWPVFGASNQLLAGLTLLTMSVWFAKMGKDNRATFIPMVFMIGVTLTALYFLIQTNLAKGNYVLFVAGSLLAVLAIFMIISTVGGLAKPKPDIKIKG